MTQRDYYEILGIDRGASDSDVKSAYRKLALKYHPDRNPNDDSAEERFKEATQAYEVLKDAQKRQTYDQYGHAGLGQGAAGFEGFGGFDISDALRAFMRDFGGGGGGGGGSIFDDIFGMGGGGRRGNRGEDLRVRMELTLEEIAKGCEKTIRVKRLKRCDPCGGSGVAAGSSRHTCPQCKGAGRVRTLSRTFLGTIQQVTTCNQCRGAGEIISEPCSTCRGEGRVRGSSTVNIKVPPGVSGGNYMMVENMGNATAQAGEPGDLVAVFEEKPHEHFTRHGDNIVCDTTVSFTTAALGGSVTVPTLDSEATLKIPAGTQSGKVMRLRGKGIPHLHRGGRGDLMVRVTVWVPTKLTSEDKQILDQLALSESMTPPTGGKSFFDKLREKLGV